MIRPWNFDWKSLDIQTEEWNKAYLDVETTYNFVDAINERMLALGLTFQLPYIYPVGGDSLVGFWALTQSYAYNLGNYYIPEKAQVNGKVVIIPLSKAFRNETPAMLPSGLLDLIPNPNWPIKPLVRKWHRWITNTKQDIQPGIARLEANPTTQAFSNPFWQTPYNPGGGLSIQPNQYNSGLTPPEECFMSGWLFQHDGTSWKPVAQSGQGDLAESTGGIKKGDIFGPWILQGIVEMVNACTVSVLSQTSSYGATGLGYLIPLDYPTNHPAGTRAIQLDGKHSRYVSRTYDDLVPPSHHDYTNGVTVDYGFTFQDAISFWQRDPVLDYATSLSVAGVTSKREFLFSGSNQYSIGTFWDIQTSEYEWNTTLISPTYKNREILGTFSPVMFMGTGITTNAQGDVDAVFGLLNSYSSQIVTSTSPPWSYNVEHKTEFDTNNTGYGAGWNIVDRWENTKIDGKKTTISALNKAPNQPYVPPVPPAEANFNIASTSDKEAIITAIGLVMDFRGSNGFKFKAE